LYKNFSASYT